MSIEQHEKYLRGEIDEYPYIDEEERELIEGIENDIENGNYTIMPKEEMELLMDKVRKGILEEERQYKMKVKDFEVLKEDLEHKGANEEVIKALEDFMSDKMVVNA